LPRKKLSNRSKGSVLSMIRTSRRANTTLGNQEP